jgi:prolyl 4-hydroxylase
LKACLSLCIGDVFAKESSPMTTPLPFRFEDQPLLWTVPGIYSASECADVVQRIKEAAPSLATNNPLHRNQDRVMMDDPAASHELFRRLKAHLPEAIGDFRLVGLNERLRYYRYAPGQEFPEHMDHWYRPSPTRITLHTLLVYFNEGFEGGETRFTEQLEQTIVPKTGMVAIFQHKIRHAGCVVRSGTKYAMRTDVIFEAPDEIGKPEFPKAG